VRSVSSAARFAAFAFLSAVILVLTAIPAECQVGGSLSGTVKDPSGAVIPGVSVTATNIVLNTMSTTVTDGQGLYSFPKLPVGRYEVTLQI
jgi:carboxypeptidase family protein